ncbi:MAG: hypothetical protein U0350_03115 [Caldilineaceae bacterium]
MSLNQTKSEVVGQAAYPNVRGLQAMLARVRHVLGFFLALYLAFILLGSSTIPALDAKDYRLSMQVAGWQFDLFSWEVQAIGQKIHAFFSQPANALPAGTGPQLVHTYLARASQIQQMESQLNKLYSTNPDHTTSEATDLQKRLDELRVQQTQDRPTVEQVIQRQIGQELVDSGLQVVGAPLPPVNFTFVEPPRKLVVSPRDHIETVYSEMLAPQIPLAQIERSEQGIRKQFDLSAYITNIGGLGAFPTMVVDRASLDWILSTVAHEWTHNYLAFFPLGFNYFASPDMTTINETVAELVGNEIGDRALRRYYPEAVPPPTPPPAPTTAAPNKPTPEQPPEFDFDTEMRETRLKVDQLLAEGKVEEAEKYMEARRLVFVQHGYALRVLNQAYFAFHGSYGTSAASTSPIGPKLEKLHQLIPDLKTFLTTVRAMQSDADLDAALAQWEKKDGSK